MASTDKYTIKKVPGGTYQIVRIDNGKVVRRGIVTSTQAIADCKKFNGR